MNFSKTNLLSGERSDGSLLGILVVLAEVDSGVALVSVVASSKTSASLSSTESTSLSSSESSSGSISLGSAIKSDISTVKVASVHGLIGLFGCVYIKEFDVTKSSGVSGLSVSHNSSRLDVSD